MSERPAPPRDVTSLLARAAQLSGRTIAELGAVADVPVPERQMHAKGLVGMLLEWHLGADAHGRAEPDFTHLGIELKTLPVDKRGKPRESTFVCSIALESIGATDWNTCRVHSKLSRVLWVPVEADPAMPLPRRRIGKPRLWSPSPQDAKQLRHDWETVAEMIGAGEVDQITGHLGRILQVRPKAAHGAVRRTARDSEGAPFATLPRGFYLRPSFTAGLFQQPAARNAHAEQEHP